ncbi:MAG: arsenate reductase family protein [Spirochaetales bacterium]|nr:arsenate reductase family protein [Spirochaetales bacterium]
MIQIFGLKKCHNTQKAERFFKERRVPFQFINLAEKGMSKGELSSVIHACGPEGLIDKQGKEYKKANLEYMDFDVEEILLENPLLFVTPVVRKGNEAVTGYAPDVWKKFIE